MSRSAGPGSPISFMCGTLRRKHSDWRDYDAHRVTLTGRERPYRASPTSALGLRSTTVSREYRCTCGHVGWSNHADLGRRTW